MSDEESRKAFDAYLAKEWRGHIDDPFMRDRKLRIWQAAIAWERERTKGLWALAKFGEWALNESREYLCDLDGGSCQDKAVELGLLKKVEVTEERKAQCSPEYCECDIGDDCFVFTDLAKLPGES